MKILDKIRSIFRTPKATPNTIQPIDCTIRCPKCGYVAYVGPIVNARTTVSCCGQWFAFDTSDGTFDTTKRIYDNPKEAL